MLTPNGNQIDLENVSILKLISLQSVEVNHRLATTGEMIVETMIAKRNKPLNQRTGLTAKVMSPDVRYVILLTTGQIDALIGLLEIKIPI